MNVNQALQLINGCITYKPDWSIKATDYTRRFMDAIKVRVEYRVPDTDIKWAPNYGHIIDTYAEFVIPLGTCNNAPTLYKRVFDCLLSVEEHESREFFSVNGTAYHKPFHPHTTDGMETWGTPTSDMLFGVA